MTRKLHLNISMIVASMLVTTSLITAADNDKKVEFSSESAGKIGSSFMFAAAAAPTAARATTPVAAVDAAGGAGLVPMARAELDDVTKEFLKSVEERNVAAVTALLERGADVNALLRYGNGRSATGGGLHAIAFNMYSLDLIHPVALALFNRDPAMLDVLLNAPGVDLSHKSIFTQALAWLPISTPAAAAIAASVPSLETLFEKGMPYHDKINSYPTLMLLVNAFSAPRIDSDGHEGRFKKAEYLLNKFRGKITNDSVVSALHLAANHMTSDFMDMLLGEAETRGILKEDMLTGLVKHAAARGMGKYYTFSGTATVLVLLKHGAPAPAADTKEKLKALYDKAIAESKAAGPFGHEKPETTEAILAILASLKTLSPVAEGGVGGGAAGGAGSAR